MSVVLGASAAPVVIDTNIALDVLVFDEPQAAALRSALTHGQVRWLATVHMREEFLRVLAYPQIATRLRDDAHKQQLLAQRDTWVSTVPDAPRCCYVCKDADDQCFIDLAVTHGALLLSKDAQVLRLRKRLARMGIAVSRQFPVV